MIKKVFFKNSQGQRLAGVLNIPDKEGKFPVFLRLHGFCSNKEGTSKIFQEKLKEEFVSLIFDYNSHGESEGNFEDFTISGALDDCQSALKFVLAQNKADASKITAVGISLGGMLGLLLAARSPIKALAVGCPLIEVKETFNRAEDVKLWKKQGWIHPLGIEALKIKYNFFEEGMRYDVYQEAEKIKCPVFIISGDKDEYIPVELLKKLTKHLKMSEFSRKILSTKNHYSGSLEPTLEILPGADHQFAGYHTYYIERTIKFLKENI